MNRIFIPFALLIIAIFGFISYSAYRTVAVEIAAEEARQGMNRERVARAISAAVEADFASFLEEENERPFYHYQFFYVPEDVTGQGQSLLRSPLADTQAGRLAVDYFQVDRKGVLSTPLYNADLPAANPGDAGRSQLVRLKREVLPLIKDKVMVTDPGDYARITLAAQPTLKQSKAQPRVVAQQAANIDLNAMSNAVYQQQMAQQAEPPPVRSTQQAFTARYQLIPAQPTRADLAEVVYSPFYALADSGLFVRRVEMRRHAFVQGFRLDREQLSRTIAAAAAEYVGSGLEFKADSGPFVIALPGGERRFDLRAAAGAAWHARAASRRRLHQALIALLGVLVLASLFAIHAVIRRQAELARRKDDFIAAVSHELRTPLAGMLMYAEMLEENWVPDEARRREYLGHIRREGGRLSRLVENVLDYARIVRRTKTFRMERNDLAAVIDEALATFAPRIEKEAFALVKEVDAPAFTFDRDAITQVLANLLDNAIKFSDERREIALSARSEGENVVIEIADRGRGVPAAERRRIFEPFYRSEHEMTRSTPGTGIGLSLVRKLVEAHRGRVVCEPRDGGGSVFRVTLPA